MSSTTATYALGRTRAEADRLHLQHQIYAASTTELFEVAGIGPGIRVLDVGSGAGDVALTVAEMVGPNGEVIGIELAPETIAIARERATAAGAGNVRFVEADLGDLDLDEGPFDAVVGRWVLMHVPDPVGLLRRLRAYVRPGGIVAFQESDLASVQLPYPEGPVHTWLSTVMRPRAVAGGPELRMGPKLYGAYLAAGLPAPEIRAHTPVGGGAAWPGYEYLAATVRSLLPAFEAMGIVTADEVDIDSLEERLRDEIVAHDGVQPLVTVYGAWTRIV